MAASDRRAAPLQSPSSQRGRALQSQVNFTDAGDVGLAPPPLRVLVVEDDDNLRELVSLALLDEGYQVAAARNGADGLERLREQQPDVILLDMQMPVMDGPTFAEHYRQLPPPHAPIVVYTAAGSARRWAERIRAAACLDKPFDLHAVSALLAHCARASQTNPSAG